MKLNAVLMMIGFTKLAYYPFTIYIENILLNYVINPAKVAARNNSNHIYDYFEGEGFNNSINNLQSLSYHFTRHCMILVLLMGYIHPKRLYKNK